MYATSMKDRIVRAARNKSRERLEAAKPGSAHPDLEAALDASDEQVPTEHDSTEQDSGETERRAS
jgi:1-acyl-sn-glycerol-3-phosphate acyltransferase